MTERYTGTLKNCNTEKGFGFVPLPGFPKNVFVHATHMPDKQPPVDGQKIEFSVDETEKGAQARNIKVLFTPQQRGARGNTSQSTARPLAGTGRPSGGAGRGPAADPAPYTFVPVQVEKCEEDGYSYPTASTFEVPGHDGAQGDGRISGKLKLTLTAHTPLLVGGRHFTMPGQERTVIEPWRLNDEHGRVVLAGSSLKGMIRHYVSALLNAPMEKVYEQFFSYRPNLELPDRKSRTRLEFREAVIERKPDESGKGMQVRVLNQGRQAIFVRSQVLDPIPWSFGDRLPEGTKIPGVNFDSRPFARRLTPGSGEPWPTDKEYQLLQYNGGISGIVEGRNGGEFSRLHEENGGKGTGLYKAVLAPTNGTPTEVKAYIVEAYRKTQQELADTKHGHSSSRNPNVGNDDDKARRAASSLKDAKALKLLNPGTLIYVEVDDAGNVVSFGHHFRYRWGYRDTVRKLNRIDNEPHTRPELSMHYEEGAGVTETGFSASLTAARAVFGYAADKELHGEVFSGSFQRLAGRVSLNHAVEVIEQDKTSVEQDKTSVEYRFVHESGSPLLPLKELGSPKASAVEFYVQQNQGENQAGRLSTYGDLVAHPGTPPGDREESCLAGRKFYRHQPGAAGTSEEQDNSRASLAHCVSRSGTRFRVTLRFQDLNEVELGALLFVMGIQHAGEFLDGKEPSEEAVEEPAYALKLGYARPLGLGSVSFALVAVERIAYEKANGRTSVKLEGIDYPAQWRQAYIQAFLNKRKEEPGLAPYLDACLEAWAYAGRQDAAYPRKDEKKPIYEFHSDLRGLHSKARRMAGNSESLLTRTALVQPAYGKKGSNR